MKWYECSKASLVCIASIAALAIGPGRAAADFTFGPAVNLGPVVNSSSNDYNPSISADGLSLYFSSNRPGGSGGYDLWATTRATVSDPWGPPVNLGPTVNSASDDWTPFISFDGLSLYFSSSRSPCLSTSSFDNDLWVTTRATPSDPWGPPVHLDEPVNSYWSAAFPYVSADGLTLLFSWAAGRPGGYAWDDIWQVTRATKDSPWTGAVALDLPINTGRYGSGEESDDDCPYMTADGLAIFWVSSRSPMYGQWGDIWMATRRSTSENWGTPKNLGPNVNSPLSNSSPSVQADHSTLYFCSNREDGLGGHDLWQAPIIPKLDLNGDGKVDQADILVILEHSGQDYSLCDISPFPWGEGVVDWQDVRVLMQYIEGGGSVLPPGPQVSPNFIPHALAVDVPCNVILSWTSPEFAETHDVYFGTSFEDVNRADRSTPLDVLVSKGQTATTYDPEGLLEYSRTYYWRVDEVIASLDSRICRGRVLQFTTEAFSYPIAAITATASSSFSTTTGPMRTIDGSGLSANGEHGTGLSTMWLSKKGQAPAWIQYEFDKVYTLHQMWVWNGNQASEPDVGLGAKDVTVEYSTDGTTWTVLDGVPQFAQAPGEPNYVHNTTVDFKGVQAKYVKLTITSNWGGKQVQCNLSEVRFLYVPVRTY